MRGTLCPWAGAVSFAAADLALLAGGPHLRRAYLDAATAKLVPAHAETCRRYRLVAPAADAAPRGPGRPSRRRAAARPLGRAARDPRERDRASPARRARVPRGHRARGPSRAGARGGRRDAQLRAVGAPRRGARAPRGTRSARRWPRPGRGELRRGLTLRRAASRRRGRPLGRADARTAASRGEQRLLALALRLAEAAVLRRRLGHAPVLLLDDILSELDREVAAAPWPGSTARRAGALQRDRRAAGGRGPTGAVWQVADRARRAARRRWRGGRRERPEAGPRAGPGRHLHRERHQGPRGARGGPQAARHVHRGHGRVRAAPPGLRGGRQLRRRGARRVLLERPGRSSTRTGAARSSTTGGASRSTSTRTPASPRPRWCSPRSTPAGSSRARSTRSRAASTGSASRS